MNLGKDVILQNGLGDNHFEDKERGDTTDIFRTWIQIGLSNDLFKRILDQIPAGIIIIETDEIVTVANETAMNLFDHQILIGEKLVFTLFRMDRTPYIYEERPPIRTLRTGKAIRGEDALFIDKKGNEYVYLISSSPIYNSGKIIAVVVVLQDITTKIRIIDALSDSEDRFRSMFENAATGMAVLTPDGHFVMVNNALCNILGCSWEDFSEATFLDHVRIKENKDFLSHYEQLIRGEITRFQMEQELIHKDGRIIWGLTARILSHFLDIIKNG
jgi:PAS domain S-box-containing protein